MAPPHSSLRLAAVSGHILPAHKTVYLSLRALGHMARAKREVTEEFTKCIYI